MRVRIHAPTLVLAALLILVECAWLQGRRQAQRIAWANEQVEQKIAAARLQLHKQHWNDAIRELEDARDVEGATNGNLIDPVWEEARRGQAEALLDAVGIALTHRHPGDALRLLRAYLAHPQAGRLDRARLLFDELERALSDDEAAQLLATLSDEALTVFVEKGQLTVEDGPHTETIRAFFQETLRRNVAKEMRKREAQREVARLTEEHRAADRTRRIARLRNSPAFHSLSTFLAQTQEQFREQQQLASRQEAELENLFRGLGVKDAAEQEQIRTDLLDRQTPSRIREQIERKRAELKRAYRNDTQFHRADGELFDQLVDQEVDKFLKMLP
jgi:hypothetical protein